MIVLNDIRVCNDHDIGSVKIGSKTFYVCSVCGRLSFRKIKSNKKVYCCKHYGQIKKFGFVTDTNPRTSMDRNEIRIDGQCAYIDLYDSSLNVVATAIIDAEDVNKVRYTKWKYSQGGYAMNSPKHGKPIHMHRVILGTDSFVDHSNHNTLDNRKSNLRICTKSQNQMNCNHKGYRKISDTQYYAYIKLSQKMINLGKYSYKEEAQYARWVAENMLFKEFRYPKPEPELPEQRKKQIADYISQKVQRL